MASRSAWTGGDGVLDNAKMERFWWALKYEEIKIKESSACRDSASEWSIM